MKESKIQEDWKNKFLDTRKKSGAKHRANYIHFDSKPDLNTACRKIFNAAYIEKHSFWPFIFYKAKAEKIKLLSDLLAKHNLSLPNNINSKEQLPPRIKKILDSDPDFSKALISTKGNPHKYATWKLRPICYASHFDSLIYSYYSDLINSDYESFLNKHVLSDNILAFRKSQENTKKCNIDHSLKAFNDIRKYKKCVVLAFDVSSFFDILDHDILKKNWLTILNMTLRRERLPEDHYSVYKSITSYSYVDRDEVYKLFKISKNSPKSISRDILKEIHYGTLSRSLVPVKKGKVRDRICTSEAFRKLVLDKKLRVEKNRKGKGIPQGSPMSGLLSNIYMIDFDIKLKAFITECSGKYYRYCDDLLCIVPITDSSSLIECSESLENFVYGLADEYKLEVNKKKTEKYAFLPSGVAHNHFNMDKNPQGTTTDTLTCAKIKGTTLSPSRLQYLGFEFDGKKITIRSSSLARYQKKLRRGIKYHLRLKKKYDPEGTLKKRKIRDLYSHVGASNFPRYVYRASDKMNSTSVRAQIKSHQKKINFQIKTISKRIDIKD